jgi:EAL domain-containing protein (putative c-di-GMP-specific phosphodiesterase class I)
LRSSCAQARKWQDSGELPARVAVNLSPIQFRRPEFVETVTQVLDETGFNPSNLELEITENVVMADFDTTEKTLQALFELGVRLVIDDFGTGYSSLTYLKRFPVCKL